uniref:Uncharacterized protein n=1 Tax=Paramoeba aestuarina TaxID=180227 RepID=A0A7S4KQB4_9EUKA|mmetsp:Transcript_22814/g.35496  ORF Transcript_22814/g.35496 Transcript_22814/m.35496 type:complete len:101 (+) Transcript_22814:358-660(+)
MTVGEFCEWSSQLNECGTLSDTLVLLSTLLEYSFFLSLSPALNPPFLTPSYVHIEKLKVKVNEIVDLGSEKKVQGAGSFTFSSSPGLEGEKGHKRSNSQV